MILFCLYWSMFKMFCCAERIFFLDSSSKKVGKDLSCIKYCHSVTWGNFMLFGKKTFLHTKKCMYSCMPLNPIKWTVTRTVLCYCAIYGAYMQSLSSCGLVLNVTQQATTATPHQKHLRVSAFHFSAALAACIQCCCKLLLIHCLRRKGSDSLRPV